MTDNRDVPARQKEISPGKPAVLGDNVALCSQPRAAVPNHQSKIRIVGDPGCATTTHDFAPYFPPLADFYFAGTSWSAVTNLGSMSVGTSVSLSRARCTSGRMTESSSNIFFAPA